MHACMNLNLQPCNFVPVYIYPYTMIQGYLLFTTIPLELIIKSTSASNKLKLLNDDRTYRTAEIGLAWKNDDKDD